MSDDGAEKPPDKRASEVSLSRRNLIKYAGTTTLSSPVYAAKATAQTGPSVNIRQVNRPEFPEVTVFATVRDSSGSSVTNLEKSDFILTETRLGTTSTQAIETLSQPEEGVAENIATSIVIDQSGSMGTGTRIQDAIRGGKNFVQQFNSGDEGLVVGFNNTVDIPQRWTTTESALTDAIDTLSPGGGTALFDGVQQGLNEANPRTDRARIGRSAVIVLADGQDNSSSASKTDVINTANQQNIPIYTIGLGNTVNAKNLQDLAAQTGGEYYQSADGSDLTAIYNEISNSITNEYELTYITNDDTTDGEQREIRLETTYTLPTASDTETYEEPCAPLPTASFDVSPQAVVETQQVSFDGTASQPNGGTLVSYQWDFNNDGSIDATGQTVTHTYTQPGEYDVALTVEKTCGARDVEVTSLAVADEPVSIVNIDTNDPIQAGETLEVKIELKNAAFSKENRTVALQDFDGNSVDVEPVQVGRGDTLNITLEWDTEIGDSGTDDVTVVLSDIKVKEEVEIEQADQTGAVSISTPRAVQQVENTRIDNTPGRGSNVGGDDDAIGNAPQRDGTPDPPLVEGKQTTVMFSVNTTSFDVSEDSQPVTATVTREFDSGNSESDTFRLPPATVAEGSIIGRLTDIGQRGGDLQTFSDVIIEDPDNYPVFSLDGDLSTISIEVTPQEETIAGDSVTLTRGGSPADDFEVESTPPLNIGFISVDNNNGLNRPYGQIGDDFPLFVGGAVDLPNRSRQQAYQDEITAGIEYAARVLPTNRINVYRHDITAGVQAEAEQRNIPQLAAAQLAGDMEEARAQLDQELDAGNVSTENGGPANGELYSVDATGDRFEPANLTIDEFDVTIGIVPFRYLNVVDGNPPPQQSGRVTLGTHMGDGPFSNTQPRQSAFVIAGAAEVSLDQDESPNTVVHEAGHHFVGDPFQGVLAQDGNDPAHARDEIVSTKYDLSAGEVTESSVTLEVPSYMSYADDNMWTDSLTTQRFIESDGAFNPTPPEDPPTSTNTNNITGTLYVSGAVTENGFEFTKLKQRAKSTAPVQNGDGAEIKLRDSNGKVITTHNLSTSFVVTPSQNGNISQADSRTVVENVVIGDVPYPEEATEVEFTAEHSESGNEITSTVSSDEIEPADSSTPPSWYDSYVNENDVVEDTGLNKAVRDSLSGTLEDSRLNTVIRSYLSGESIEL